MLKNSTNRYFIMSLVSFVCYIIVRIDYTDIFYPFDAANIQLFLQTMNLYLIFPANHLPRSGRFILFFGTISCLSSGGKHKLPWVIHKLIDGKFVIIRVVYVFFCPPAFML